MDSELLKTMYICEGGKLLCKWWYDLLGKCQKPSERLVSPEVGDTPAVYRDVVCPIGDVPNPHQQETAEVPDSILG